MKTDVLIEYQIWLMELEVVNLRCGSVTVTFQLHASLPVTFGQILLTGQPLVNFTTLLTIGYFRPPRVVQMPISSKVEKVCFRSILGPFGPKKKLKNKFFHKKGCGSVLIPYLFLFSCVKSEKT